MEGPPLGPGGEGITWPNQVAPRGRKASSTRKNQTSNLKPFDAVLLRRDKGNQEVPPVGRVAQEDHERVLRAVIRAWSPNRKPTWPAFLEGGAVLCVMDAEANNLLPQAIRTADIHWRYRRRKPPPLQPLTQPQPPHKRRRR